MLYWWQKTSIWVAFCICVTSLLCHHSSKSSPTCPENPLGWVRAIFRQREDMVGWGTWEIRFLCFEHAHKANFLLGFFFFVFFPFYSVLDFVFVEKFPCKRWRMKLWQRVAIGRISNFSPILPESTGFLACISDPIHLVTVWRFLSPSFCLSSINRLLKDMFCR